MNNKQKLSWETIKELYKTSVKKYVIANYTALEPTRNAILKEKEWKN